MNAFERYAPFIQEEIYRAGWQSLRGVQNAAAQAKEDPQAVDDEYRDTVIPAMETLRAAVDSMEVIVSTDYWPVPNYNSMLFWV